MDDLTNKAFAVADLLAQHNGKDVVVIDLRALSLWTDFFVLATVTSAAHLAGLHQRVKEWSGEESGITARSTKFQKDNTWNLIDLGGIVIHLMTASAREFYELENLWSEGIITRL